MKKRPTKTELRNGCSRTQVFFSPANYKTLRSTTDLEKDWFVECRFHDPAHEVKYPNGFQYRKRTNGFSTLSERKTAMGIYKEEMEKMLDELNYNPISKQYMSSESGELSPYTDANTAMELARLKISGSPNHLKQIRRCVARVSEAFTALNYSYLNISEIRLYHIKNALEKLDLPPNTYNKFRQYLKDVFSQLIQFGATEQNPCTDIIRKKVTSNIREVLTDAELALIDPYLEKNHPTFYRYRMIFGMSGGRSSELLRVQRKHVRLDQQEYTVQIQKGRSFVWATKVILLDALPYWEELLADGENPDAEDFIFSRYLKPGKMPINPVRITQRWKRIVKESNDIKDENGMVVKITADFYTLKHRFIDQLDALHSNAPIIPLNPAKAMASHKSDKMTAVYATGRTSRKNEELKNIRII